MQKTSGEAGLEQIEGTSRSNITESAHGHAYSNGPIAMYLPE
jgi:hypothetical protein